MRNDIYETENVTYRLHHPFMSKMLLAGWRATPTSVLFGGTAAVIKIVAPHLCIGRHYVASKTFHNVRVHHVLDMIQISRRGSALPSHLKTTKNTRTHTTHTRIHTYTPRTTTVVAFSTITRSNHHSHQTRVGTLCLPLHSLPHYSTCMSPSQGTASLRPSRPADLEQGGRPGSMTPTQPPATYSQPAACT